MSVDKSKSPEQLSDEELDSVAGGQNLKDAKIERFVFDGNGKLVKASAAFSSFGTVNVVGGGTPKTVNLADLPEDESLVPSTFRIE